MDKETMREVAHSFGKTDAEFESAWAGFERMRAEAERLKAAGIAIHPTFARWEPE